MEKSASLPELSRPLNSGTYTSENEYLNFDDVKRFIKRYVRTIAISMLIAVAGATLYIIFSTPLFTARAQIVIDPSLAQPLREIGENNRLSLDSAQVESQLAVLRSEKIATAVINKLDLRKKADFSNGSRSLIDLVSQFFLAPPDPVSDFVKERVTLYRFQSGLDARRVGISYAIDISFTSPNPQLASDIANATAEAYIQEVVAAKSQAATRGSLWLEERINDLRKQMNAAALKVQRFRSKRDYRIAANGNGSRKDSSANASEGDHKRSQRSFEELESQAQTYRRLYESFLVAYTEAVQKKSYPVSNARVITPATPPLRKSHPRTKLILVFGAFLGCLAGFGIALFRHSLDRSVRSTRHIREEVGIEHLSNIPLTHARQFRPKLLPQILGRHPRPNRLSAIIDLPFSGFSHGVKRLKAAISLAGRTQTVRCIGIASALPNEGKTTIAANLAMLYATTGKRTLIIDCDLRTSSLSRQLGEQAEHGIIEAINTSVELENCIEQTNYGGLALMPALGGETIADSGELLGSEKMRLLLQRLADEYEIVIVDMPPIADLSEGVAMSSALDKIVLVAEWGVTPLPILAEVARSLRNANAEILGAVINKVDPTNFAYGKPQTQYFSYVSSSRNSR